MIFLTVGTTLFPFSRLFRIVKRVIDQLHTNEKLIMQTNKKEIPFPIMIKLMKKSRVIVCHGGPATIFLALQHNNNKPFIIPRRAELGEHTDNHQMHFASWMMKNDQVAGSLEKNCLQELATYLKSPIPAPKRNIEASANLLRKLIQYTKILNS